MTMHDQLVGVFSEMLANLDKVLTKAESARPLPFPQYSSEY